MRQRLAPEAVAKDHNRPQRLRCRYCKTTHLLYLLHRRRFRTAGGLSAWAGAGRRLAMGWFLCRYDTIPRLDSTSSACRQPIGDGVALPPAAPGCLYLCFPSSLTWSANDVTSPACRNLRHLPPLRPRVACRVDIVARHPPSRAAGAAVTAPAPPPLLPSSQPGRLARAALPACLPG